MAPTLDVVVKETDFSPNTDLNVILEWTASDVDTDDTLTFDVYLETTPISLPISEDLTPKSENQAETTYNAALSARTDYYWAIVVKDNNGDQTIGQVWSFKTD